MATTKRTRATRSAGVRRLLPSTVVAAVDRVKIVGIRAGAQSDHRFIGVWPIVVQGRVFARSWTRKRDGWNRAFENDPLGVLQVGDREIRVRARKVRATRVLDAIDQAYAEKYPTPGSVHYVRGFRAPGRRATTIEFMPR
jgi:hypothetical protein